ncbi:MAG TPA: TAT-variant-translocated molybdopterin oxidoreductase, partial [Candidatus Acidoferrum sp.]|nr:TAT-variant-translocated molybdopterin oxidoreductase [Candidatus Acidoferrum sp.]
MSDHEQEKQLRILQGPQAAKSALEAGHGHDQEDEEVVDDTLREHRLELSTVREKLSGKSGKQYWRTLEELSEDPHFTELLHREFPRHASEWDDAVDRRD